MELERIVLYFMLLGSCTYAGYRIKKRRDELRRTIQIVGLQDVDFWETLGDLRGTLARA